MGRKNERGFTMLEVLFAITIMGITILPLLGLMASAPRLHIQREQQMRAAFLAQLRVEDIKHDAMANFSGDYNKASGAAGDFPAPDTDFRYTATDDLNANIKTISVTVWHDADSDDAIDENEFSVTVNAKVTRRN